MRKHIVKRGQCISTLAGLYGLTAQQIWNAPDNADLKKRRKTGDILLPGDQVAIPDVQAMKFSVGSGQTQDVKIKRPKARLRMILHRNGKALDSADFTLMIGKDIQTGKTDGTGLLDVAVPVDAIKAILVLPAVPMVEELLLGCLAPSDTVSGAQQRLRNLGATHVPETGTLDDQTATALRAFQKAQSINETGKLDAATIKALEDQHGG